MALLALGHCCFEVAFVYSIHHQGVLIHLQCSTLLPVIGFCGHVGGTKEWNDCRVLVSKSHEYLGFVRSKLKHHEGPFIYSTNIVFKDQQRRDITHLLGAWVNVCKRQGFESSLITHADFGGGTLAVHLLSYKKVDASVFKASAS
jgi:hypothetical protein